MEKEYRVNKTSSVGMIDRTFFFSIGYGIWILMQLLPRTIIFNDFSSQIFSAGRFFGLVIACLPMLYKKRDQYNLTQILSFVSFSFVILFSNVYLANTSRYIEIIILIFMGTNIDFRRFFRNTVILLIIFYGAIVLFSEVKIIPTNISYRDGSVRNSLGFGWSTWPVHGFFYIIAGLIAFRNYRMRGYEFLLLELINIYFYYKTNTRSPFFLITGLLIVTYLVKIFRVDFRKVKIVYLGFLLSIPSLFTIMFFISKNGTSFLELNALLSDRLVLGHNAILRYGVGLFGQPIKYVSSWNIVGTAYDYIDSSYLSYLLNYGILSSVVFVVCWMSVQRKLFMSSNQMMWISLFFLILNGFIDPQFIELFYNYFIILMSLLLSEKKVQNEFLFQAK